MSNVTERALRRAAAAGSNGAVPGPDRIGPYRILGVLGRGGMAVVYRGEHGDTREPAAIKMALHKSASSLAAVRREIAALGSVRHPGVVRVLGQGVEGGLPWYAMEVLHTRTLRSDLQELAASGPEERWSRLRPFLGAMHALCAPLAFVHGRGIVHRDLKPENILVRADGTPVLVDFGISSFCPSTAEPREVLAAGGEVIGSVSYMAPEQILGEFVDARADLYAVGCILYEGITGKPPFSAESLEAVLLQHLTEHPEPPSALVDGVPLRLDELIVRLLEKRPQDRLGHAHDVKAALEDLGIEARPSGDEPRAEPYLYRPPFVGREDALRTLDAALDRAHAGEGNAVFIEGESGAGKTRLAMELSAHATRCGFRVITSSCVPIGGVESNSARRAAPLDPLRPFLLAVADRCREGGAKTTAHLLGLRGPLLAANEPSLAQVPGFEGPTELPRLPAPAARARMLEALRETLLAFTELSPILLMIDDLQWADDVSASFLASLLATPDLRRHRVLVVGAYRSEDVGSSVQQLSTPPGALRLSLDRFDLPAIRTMVGGMLALRDPARDLLDFLARQSRGNPFFVAECLRAAIGQGLLYRDRLGKWSLDERCRPAGQLDEVLPLPKSLRDLITSRLRCVDARFRPWVEIAAALGREFELDLLMAAMSATEEESLAAVEALRARQILEENGPDRLCFVHDKLREIAYEMIPAMERVSLHRAIAEAIEVRYGNSPELERFAGRLGHHWTVAERLDRACPCLLRAGDRARAAYAYDEAIDLYRAAAGQAQGLHATYVADSDRWAQMSCRILDSLGDVLGLSGRHEEAKSAYQQAFSMTSEISRVERARLLRKIGEAWEMQHQHDEALGAYAAAEALLEQVRPADEPASGEASGTFWHEWVELQVHRGWIHYWLAQADEMGRLVERVRRVVEERGTPLQRAQFLRALSLTSTQLRRVPQTMSSEAVASARAALTSAEESGDARELALGRFVLGFQLLFHGDLGEAEQCLSTGLLEAERMNDLTLTARFLTYLIMIHRRHGRVEAIRRAADRALSAAISANMKDYAGAVRANLAWIALREGDLMEVRRSGAAALELWRQSSSQAPYPFQWLARWPLLAVELASGRLAEAMEHAQALLDPMQQRPSDEVATWLCQGVEAWELGAIEPARACLEQAVSAAQRLGDL